MKREECHQNLAFYCQARDEALAWDVATNTWTLDHKGGSPSETKPRTLLLKESPL